MAKNNLVTQQGAPVNNAAENLGKGTPLTHAELDNNFFSIYVAENGTAEASKALITDANVDINGIGVLGCDNIFLDEQAAADADQAGKGQVWVKTATPNELWFTDDATNHTQLTGNGSGHSVIVFYQGTISAASTVYIPISSSFGTLTATESLISIPCPISGTIGNLYARTPANTFADGNTVLTLMKGGAAQATTCSIPFTQTTNASDTTNTFAVTAGDLLSLKVDTSTQSSGSATNLTFSFEIY